MKMNKIPREIILWGGTGQAKVMRPIVEHYGSRVVAVFDDTPNLPSPFADIKIYRGWDGFRQWIKAKDRKKIGFCIAIGNPHGRVRLKYHERLIKEGLKPVTLIHPNAWIEESAEIGIGAQILAGAKIGVEVKIGRQCIINTNASVDHECVLEGGVEIAPGATLCGSIHAGVNAWVCAGAVVLPRVKIGNDAIVGAGAVVTKNVPDGVTVIGVPAKEKQKEKD